MNNQELTLEQALDLLDQKVALLQDASLPLEEAFAAYSEGMALIQQCEEKLDLVEKQVMQINEQGQIIGRQAEVTDSWEAEEEA